MQLNALLLMALFSFMCDLHVTCRYAELADGDSDLVVCHEALDFGQCKLALGVPMGGKFAAVESIEQLRTMPNWTRDTPLRVVTGWVVSPWACALGYYAVPSKLLRCRGVPCSVECVAVPGWAASEQPAFANEPCDYAVFPAWLVVGLLLPFPAFTDPSLPMCSAVITTWHGSSSVSGFLNFVVFIT